MRYLLLFENFDTTSHLKGRGIDTEKTRVIIDEESGDTFFFLYNLTGQMVGYQKYNPKFPKKGQSSKTLGNPKDTKYYNWVGEEDEGKKIAVWGLESYNVSDKYMFNNSTQQSPDTILNSALNSEKKIGIVFSSFFFPSLFDAFVLPFFSSTAITLNHIESQNY